jgi:hypothetical protein
MVDEAMNLWEAKRNIMLNICGYVHTRLSSVQYGRGDEEYRYALKTTYLRSHGPLVKGMDKAFSRHSV